MRCLLTKEAWNSRNSPELLGFSEAFTFTIDYSLSN
jgi:hypothetical protein